MKFDVAELNAQARKLPFQMPEFTPAAGSPVPSLSEASAEAKALYEGFKPLIERMDLDNKLVGTGGARAQFSDSYKLIAAQMIANVARSSPSMLHREATTAGADVPSWQFQNIGTIIKALPQMIAPQLFPVVPFSLPDGRVFFRTSQYDSNLTSSAPNVAKGDDISDISKFNVNYTSAPEGSPARKVKLTLKSMSTTVGSHRLVGDMTYEGTEDLQAIYNVSAQSVLIEDMGFLVAYTTDRGLINAAIQHAGSTHSWEATPTGYESLAPSEKKVVDEQIWTEGVLPLLTKISKARRFNATPTWAIVGSAVAERFAKLSTWVSVASADGKSATIATGALRDVGTLREKNIRVIVDDEMNENIALFGSKPTRSFDPGIIYTPYKPLRVVGPQEAIETGELQVGVYSRFGIVTPNTAVEPLSAQLGAPYGVLTIVP